MRRTVVSVSVSPRNPDAAAVAEALAERGIPLTHCGGQLLAWAAAYLAGRALERVECAEATISDDELDVLLDAL